MEIDSDPSRSYQRPFVVTASKAGERIAYCAPHSTKKTRRDAVAYLNGVTDEVVADPNNTSHGSDRHGRSPTAFARMILSSSQAARPVHGYDRAGLSIDHIFF